jgi:PKD repeat protein
LEFTEHIFAPPTTINNNQVMKSNVKPTLKARIMNSKGYLPKSVGGLLVSIALFVSLNLQGQYIQAPDTIQLGTSVTFSHNLINANSQIWYFGDGDSSSLASPSHIYTNGACEYSTITIDLFAIDSNNTPVQSTKSVVLHNHVPMPELMDLDFFTPFSNCDNSPSISNPNFSISLLNITADTTNIDFYTINWGDNSPVDTFHYSNFTLQHTYQQLGLFPFSIHAHNSFGCSKTKNYTIANQSNPAVGLSSLGSTQGCAPQEFTFILSQYQSNSPGTYYVWNFGDGSPSVTWNYNDPYANDSIKHVFQNTSCQNGQVSFTVSVTAYNYCDQTTATVSNIRIYSSPQAQFDSSSDTTCVSANVNFSNNTLSGFGYNCNGNAFYHWNFGDGSQSSQTNPNHSYSNPGTYTVVLTATNGVCGTSQDSTSIVVNDLPHAVAQLPSNQACDSLIVSTSNLSTGGNLNYQWNIFPSSGWQFTNGSSNTSKNPEILFHTKGIYTITLGASNNCGFDDTTYQVTIMKKPELTLQSIPDFCGTAQVTPVALIDSNYASISNYQWSFGNGQPSSSNGASAPPISYSSPATEVISLSISNICGSSSDQVSFTIHALPQVNATASIPAICVGDSTTLQASGAQNYQWSDAINLNLGNTNTLVVSPSQNSTYYLTGQDSNQCVNTDSISITVHNLPNVSIVSNSTQLCLGDTIQALGNGAINYQWYQAGTLMNSSSQFNYAPTQSEKIILSGTDANGCNAQDSLSYQVFTPPTLSISNTTPSICLGDSIQIQISGATTIQLSPGVTQNQNTYTFAPSGSQNYQIHAFDLAGCQSDTSLFVQVNPLPSISITSSAQQICLGDSLQFTAQGGISYQWLAQNNNQAQITTYPQSSGQIILQGWDANGCINFDTASYQVLSLPLVAINSSSNSICEGNTIQLTASGAVNYQWKKNNTFFSNTSYFTDSLLQNTSYILKGTDASGCINHDTITIQVNPLPLLQANLSSSSLCFGDSVSLSLTGGSSYQINNIAASASSYLKPQTNTTYQIKALSNAGCSSDTSVGLVVYALPQIQIQSGFNQICLGDSFNFLAQGGNNYSWFQNNNLVANASPLQISPSTSGTIILKGESTQGCVNMDTFHYQVNPLPNIQASAIQAAICQKDSFHLHASGGIGYDWSVNNKVVSNASSYHGTLMQSSNFTLRGEDNHGCINYDSIQILVHSLPVVQAQLSSNQICTGDSVAILLTGAQNYTINGLASPSQNYLTPIQTSTYQLIGRDINNCLDTSQFHIQVNPLPQVSASASLNSICLGQSTQLTATGANQYMWEPQQGLGSQSGNSVTATPVQSVTYKLKGIDANGCANLDSIHIVVSTMLSIQAQASQQTICLGDTVALSAFGANTYQWNSGNGLLANTGTTVYAVPGTSSTYVVTGTDTLGCISTQSVSVVVNPLPSVQINASALSICPDDSVSLQAHGAKNYTWEIHDGTLNPIQIQGLSINYAPLNATQIMVTGLDSNQCSATKSVQIQIKNLPQIQAHANKDSICVGETVTLMANGGQAYQWQSTANLSQPYGNSTSSTPLNNNWYKVSGQGSNGCYNVDSVYIHVLPLPVISTLSSSIDICQGDSAMMGVIGNGNVQWTPGTGINTSIGNQIMTSPVNSTIYTATLTDIYGCSNAAQIQVNVNQLPHAAFSVDSITCRNANTPFINQSQNTVSFQWDFGDSLSSSAQAPSHAYSSVGYYEASLIAISSNNCVDTAKKVIHIIDAPTAQYTAFPNCGCSPLNINLTNTSNYYGGSAFWQTNTGITSNQGQPQNMVLSSLPGQDTTVYLTLTTSNICGSSSYVDTFQISASPIANFGYNLNTQCSPATASFGNISSANSTTYTWDFGDTTYSNQQTPNPHIFITNSAPRDFTVRLIANNSCGSDTSTKIISVNPNSVTSMFTPSSVQACAPADIQFANYSNIQNSASWSFGDGNVSSSINPNHTYVNPGTYQVSLIVTDNCGIDTAQSTIVVNAPPTVSFNTSQDTLCQLQNLQLQTNTSNLTNLQWDLGDSSTSSLASFSHQYTQSGVFYISLIGEDANTGCTDTVSQPVIVFPTAQAQISVNDPDGCYPLTVQFDNNSSSSCYYSWDFDNGNTSISNQPTHTFSNPGTYQVSLIADNFYGCSDTAYTIVKAYPRPVASYHYINQTPCESPATLSFVNNSTGANGYLWDFDNSDSSKLKNPSFYYAVPGTYHTSLIAYNTYNCTDTAWATIQLHPIPVANFTASSTEGCEGLPVQFTNLSLGSVSYNWDFGNGKVSTQKDPLNIYKQQGNYHPSLIVYNHDGCSDTVAFRYH